MSSAGTTSFATTALAGLPGMPWAVTAKTSRRASRCAQYAPASRRTRLGWQRVHRFRVACYGTLSALGIERRSLLGLEPVRKCQLSPGACFGVNVRAWTNQLMLT
jgi:hypothetical protein